MCDVNGDNARNLVIPWRHGKHSNRLGSFWLVISLHVDPFVVAARHFEPIDFGVY